MKDPDAAYNSLSEVKLGEEPQGVSHEERESIYALRRDEAEAFAKKWLRYGEYAELEFDTETGTCVVIKR